VSVSTFGDGFGGGTISMGDRPSPAVPHPAEPSSAGNTIVEEQSVKEVPIELEKVEEVEVQPQLPANDVAVDNEPGPPAPATDYQSFFIRDTVHDGTIMSPTHVFQQTWTLYNPGPSSWPVGSSVRFVGGDAMLNVDTQHPSDAISLVSAMASNELTAPLAPGESAEFSVTLKTPQREGTAISYWRLKLPDGTPFGHKLWCDVEVREEPESKEVLEVKEEPTMSKSNMIFPKLEKESPVSSTHEAMTQTPTAPSAPSLSNTDERDVLEDVESLALEDVETDDDGFLTDEEYDILDASDQESSYGKHD
jgi:next-to-BRCA1 protein 1